MKGWIGVDLDGTLAEYHGWQGTEHIGPPIQAMKDRVMLWLRRGKYDVKIFTARVSDPEQATKARRAIKFWLAEYDFPELEVTCQKDYNMVELWDDRCVQVIANTGEPVGKSTRGLV